MSDAASRSCDERRGPIPAHFGRERPSVHRAGSVQVCAGRRFPGEQRRGGCGEEEEKEEEEVMMMMMMNVHHEPVNEALIRDDGDVLYPVRDDIPIMLIDESESTPTPPAVIQTALPQLE